MIDILFRPDIEDIDDENGTVVYECETYLTGIEHLHGLPAETSPYVRNLLLYLGTMNGNQRLEIGREYFYNETSLVSQVYANPGTAPDKNAVNVLANVPYSVSTSILYKALLSQNTTGNTHGRRTAAYALNAAHQVARHPILTILGAEEHLPRVNEKAGEEVRTIVTIELGVKWERVYLVLGSILGGQLLAIAVATFMCRGIPLQEPQSYLSVASLLRDATIAADSLDWDKTKLRYGGKVDGCDDTYEIGLWVDGAQGDIVEGIPCRHFVTGIAGPGQHHQHGPVKHVIRQIKTA